MLFAVCAILLTHSSSESIDVGAMPLWLHFRANFAVVYFFLEFCTSDYVADSLLLI